VLKKVEMMQAHPPPAFCTQKHGQHGSGLSPQTKKDAWHGSTQSQGGGVPACACAGVPIVVNTGVAQTTAAPAAARRINLRRESPLAASVPWSDITPPGLRTGHYPSSPHSA
jgi:hypothetical protein